MVSQFVSGSLELFINFYSGVINYNYFQYFTGCILRINFLIVWPGSSSPARAELKFHFDSKLCSDGPEFWSEIIMMRLKEILIFHHLFNY